MDDATAAREWMKRTCPMPAPESAPAKRAPAVPKTYHVDPPIAELVPEKWDKNTISTWLLQMMHNKHFAPQHRIKCLEDYCKIQGIFDVDAIPAEEEENGTSPCTFINPPLTDDEKEDEDKEADDE
ncbi:MAG: hypothetical protein MJ014_00220 [Methanocorpusculum sp.]|nr:hypothetical protein [Methanocorpusculum sp.]